MEKDANQKIVVLPFQYIGAFSDVETGQIFVGNSFLGDKVLENVAHELAHVISGDPDHDSCFEQQLGNSIRLWILDAFAY